MTLLVNRISFLYKPCKAFQNKTKNLQKNKEHNTFIVPGGKTPGIFFQILARRVNNWNRTTLVLSDERLVNVESPRSNTYSFKKNLIDYIQGENLPEIPGVIIPRKTINELCKLLADITGTIKINLDPNKIIFFINQSVLVSKLIDGNFPDYEKVIPKNNTNILKVDRSLFSMAVDRVSTIINEKSPAIKLKLLNNLMNISSVDSENGLATEDIVTEYSGNQMEVGFNSKYILEMINNLEDDKITLSFNDTSSPVIATEQSNPDLIYVLMPMRV